jgi:C-terminal processing protease CtpA/Prc
VIFPQGGIAPPVSTLNYVAGQTIANAAVVSAGMNGGVAVIAGVSGTDLIIDINGYFSGNLNAGESLVATSSDPAVAAIQGTNNSTGIDVKGEAVNGTGVQGVSISGTAVEGVGSVSGVVGVANADGPYHGVVGISLATVNEASDVLGR